jgi:chromosome segregation protein
VLNGAALHSSLLPGQRLVSLEGDLWRWDGFRTTAKDAPSAAALRLEQQNRLEQLKEDLISALTKADATELVHQSLNEKVQVLTKADQNARVARRDADGMVADAGRTVSKAESERNLALGRVEALSLSGTRHAEEAADVFKWTGKPSGCADAGRRY